MSVAVQSYNSFGGNPIYLPLQSSNLDKVESAFLNENGLPHFNVALGLGASSRVKDGQCVDRHFSTGICWGGFEGEDTRFVNNHDHNTSCALEANWLQGSVTMALGPNQGAVPTNYMSTYSSAPPSQTNGCPSRSYGVYSSCVNCSLSGAAVYQCGLSNDKATWATNPAKC